MPVQLTQTFNVDASIQGFSGVTDTIIYQGLEFRYVRTELGVGGDAIFWVYETVGKYLRIWNNLEGVSHTHLYVWDEDTVAYLCSICKVREARCSWCGQRLGKPKEAQRQFCNNDHQSRWENLKPEGNDYCNGRF
ncbi:MAG: hypothetical protein A2Y53_00105 [Chloroflexi bacterium RBG_16_47_49]|nr:MAG: hypothetical protein A2Y53_00105 [Chloroflexi bacterium RBG_16_47_49]